jgi:HEAT repeat protein
VDAAVSLSAIAALAERREDESAQALLDLLGDRRNFYLPVTRQAAAVALSHLGLYGGDRLSELLRTESDEAVRAALLSATPPAADSHTKNGVVREPSTA